VFNPIVEHEEAQGHESNLNTALMLLRKRKEVQLS
jgi:hypothetical protein